MKLATSARLLAIALALSTTVVGCRKGLDKTTLIPGSKPASIADSNANPIRDIGPGSGVGGVNPNGNPFNNGGVTGTPAVFDPKNGEGIAAVDGDKFANWKENREEFAAQTVYFDFDKSNIKPGEIKKLEEVAKRMAANFPGKALRIEGHCDERGTEEYNRSLGDRRALSVREKLAALAVNPEMLPTITFGEEKPADAGHDDAAFSKNRRAELILLTPP